MKIAKSQGIKNSAHGRLPERAKAKQSTEFSTIFKSSDPVSSSQKWGSSVDSISKFADPESKHLVLGLEHTLISFSRVEPSQTSQFYKITISKDLLCYVIFRPGLVEFLSKVSQIYTVSIFTMFKYELAKEILEASDASKYISMIYHQDHCKKLSEEVYLKSLVSLKFPMQNTVFIEESPTQIRSQPLNGLLIKRFDGSQDDQALLFLKPFLEALAKDEDVRSVAKKLYQFFNQYDSKTSQTKLETRQPDGL